MERNMERNNFPKSGLYTKTGDNGTTNLYDMRRLPKDDCIFVALGDLDELSVNIGELCVRMTNMIELREEPNFKQETVDTQLKALRVIQDRLLTIGSDFATTRQRNDLVTITQTDINMLEKYIDILDGSAPPLTVFILPGQTSADSQAHICRSICRRAERNMIAVRNNPRYNMDDGEVFHVGVLPFVFINRLSDYFFALARFLQFFSAKSDIKRGDHSQWS